MKYYIDNLTIEIIEAMTYKFILDLLIITEDRASEYISLDDLNIVRLDLPLKKFNNLKISDKGRERLANDTYQLILNSTLNISINWFILYWIIYFREALFKNS